MTSKKRALDSLTRTSRITSSGRLKKTLRGVWRLTRLAGERVLGFGNVALVKEDARAVWVSRRIDETRQDVGYALRTLRRNRGATPLGILVMALAIGANTAVFSVVHAVVLNPLPFSNADRMVTLFVLLDERQPFWQTGEASVRPGLSRLAGSKHVIRFDGVLQAGTRSWLAPWRSMPSREGNPRVLPRSGRASVESDGRSPARRRKEGGTGAAIVSERYARQTFGDPTRAPGRTCAGRPFVPIVGVFHRASTFPWPRTSG